MVDVALGVLLHDERRLVETSVAHGHRIVLRCSGADELAARVPAARPDLAVVSASEQYLSRRLVAACDAAGVRLVITAATEGERRRAQSLGLVDIAVGPVDWPTLLGQGAPSVEAARPASGSAATQADTAGRRRGRVVTVWGPHGAPGRTTIAINLAAELAAAGVPAVLADADTHAASIAPALGLLDEAPGFAAACRLAGSGSLDAVELERIAQTHRSRSGSFRVLTGLGRPSRWPELTAERISTTLEAARDWAEMTIVDVAAEVEQDDELSSDLVRSRRNAATAVALRAADHVVLVGAADPIGLARLLRAHAELLDTVSPREVTVVINKLRASAVGMNPAAQVRQTLDRFGGIEEPVLVPHDAPAIDGALLSGATLVETAPRSAVRAPLRRLVLERLLETSRPEEAATRPERRRGARRRLPPTAGARAVTG